MTDKEWHKEVCENAGYICQVCGKDYSHPGYFDEHGVNQYVCGHHRLTKGARHDLRHDIANGLCVDRSCHEALHRANKHL